MTAKTTGWVVAEIDDKGRASVAGWAFTYRSERAAQNVARRMTAEHPGRNYAACALMVLPVAAPSFASPTWPTT